MGWIEALEAKIKDRWAVGEAFTLEDVYGFAAELTNEFPNNRHVADKIRQVLQQLRDRGVVDFLDYQGQYRRLR